MFTANKNKTGSHQCTQAVCSTFAEIHSILTSRCIDALFGVRIPFQTLAPSPKGIPDSSPPVQSCLHCPRPSYIYPTTPETAGLSITFGNLLACRSYYWTFSHCFYRISFCSCLHVRSRRNLLLLFTAGIGITHRVFHWQLLRELLIISYISKWKRTHTHIYPLGDFTSNFHG